MKIKMLPNFLLRSVTFLILGLSLEPRYSTMLSQVLAVPVTVSADETTISPAMGTHLRKTLCQPNQTSLLYRYDRESKKCYEIGERGPCGQNMIFYSEENSSAYGECDCDYENTNIPAVYHDGAKKCFFLYTKAYCDADQWLVFDSNLKPQCEYDKCKDLILFDQTDSSIFVPFKDHCVPLHSRHRDCKTGEVVTFQTDEILPSCGPKDWRTKVIGTSVFAPFLRCRPGSRRDLRGKCRPVIKLEKLKVLEV